MWSRKHSHEQQRKSNQVMFQNRAVLELYFREHGRYPAAPPSGMFHDLAGELNRKGRRIVERDGWGEFLHYIVSPDGQHYLLMSPGRNGKLEYRPGELPPEPGNDVGQDTVIADGEFFYFYQGVYPYPAACKTTPAAWLECQATGGYYDCRMEESAYYQYDNDPAARTTTAPRRLYRGP